VAIITRGFLISAALVYGYLVLTFPIHYYLHNPYINPLLSSVAAVAKIYDSDGYLFGSYYPNIQVNILGIAFFLIALALLFMIVSILYYRKSDAIL
jgi:hypothetical protein